MSKTKNYAKIENSNQDVNFVNDDEDNDSFQRTNNKENTPLLINNDISINYASADHENNSPPVTGADGKFIVYKRRWWVLFMFTLLSLNQCNFWITFSTVAVLAKQYYNTDLARINFLTELGPILYVPFSVVFSWSINRYGIRPNILIASALVAIGGAVRSVPGIFPLVIIGQSFNAIAGPFMMTVPTKISNVWFPPEERTFSTAISTVSNFSGSAIGFLLALFATTDTHLKYLLYAEAVSGALIFIAILIYYPEKPPTPPSATALEAERAHQASHIGLLDSWKQLFIQSYRFLRIPSASILTIVSSITSGCYAGWSAILTEIIVNVYTPSQGAVEVSFPIPEAVGSSLISILINVFTFVSIEVGSLIPPQTLNWMLVGCSAVSVILLLFVKEDYKRLKSDAKVQ
ncbi:hypothetical protein PPL_08470 [Heterostelium album PN500]|uniref:Major facilitator superfamily (MFS) profile domain-containing protein n=1 Tax=Heterostelium pallidum (strain ATCC 26659 / Pp 5 / PN500) TaxID=670386 RepID=D3BIA2_HETP5|nr:hypothetical protein PPL_08470 [Heterostelium album PN500]EFA79002.1 hypothetical protein PPL_08470 [Heterostelium album PN500]|eukprot:XP_020431126.1 hypothetical protein PPL_08470 [Heterostelium album PN500]